MKKKFFFINKIELIIYKKMYVFKPFVFDEHLPNSIAKPEGRTKSKIRCDGKNLYIYSGKDPLVMDYRELADDHIFVATKPEFREIWMYNLPSQQWKLLGNEKCLPDINDKVFGTIFESNYLVICSIRVPFNDAPSSRKCRLHICNLSDESVLVQGTSGEIPYPSFANNLIRHKKYFFTVGVTRDLDNFSDVYRLNMENGVWNAVYRCRELDPNEPLGRNGHTLVYDGKMIYIFGGSTDSPGLDAFIFTKLSAFDLEKYRWTTVDTIGDKESMPHFPTAREDFGVTQYTHPNSGEINVIISGGTVDHNDAFDDVWQLNLTSLKWTCLEKFGTALPHSVDSHSMSVSPTGKLFTFGGFIADEKAHGSCSSTLHSAWLTIPKLTEICWEALFFYYPDLKSMTDKEINALGIPLQLLKSRII
ncbi:kelch domain-containing protein 10 homolog isoform X2 [Cotesia glomerata]|uniref:kelch domain-containing protein 10 homolog isoform X2 n=1 Tax=Cotesia glomerata TaxID=32391 RepID=UPI001D01D343|nr:kelch domain-containing protein 10 homolog isoform X2 [Cotesia glomerata]